MSGGAVDPIVTVLQSRRLELGLSMQKLGERMGLTTYACVYNWESGTTSPTLRNLRRWALALDVDLDARCR